MATTRSFLLIPVTLCSFLLVLAAAEQGKAILVIQDKVRCKSDLSRIISNAPVHLVINNATVPGGTGRTTSDGQLLMTVNLNSTEQLAALMSNGSSKAYVIPLPGASGVPSLSPGKQMAAAVEPIAMVTISSDDVAAGSSVQRPAVAASDTTPLLARVVNGRLHVTNNGDADHLNEPFHIIYAKLKCVVIGFGLALP
ncbi:uncharacterized protein [Miscanthus floridulus]|uniref:uncharacterized protein n=1 Tax=Miscanthus floridulus TaxID=154761 RepID=UPI003459068B